MKRPDLKIVQRILYTALALFLSVECGVAIHQRYREFLAEGHLVPTFLLICLVTAFGLIFSLLLIWKPQWLAPFRKLRARLPILSKVLALLICLVPGLLYNFLQFSEPYGAVWIRVFLFALSILLSAWLLEPERDLSFVSLIRAALGVSVSFILMVQFHDASSYPFGIGWSEGNRMWDYSVLFGRDLYNFPQDQVIPAYIDIGRQSLWGLIFLLPRVSILMMRCWNDFLFTIPCAILGWLLFKQTPHAGLPVRLALSLWTMLFLMQGPIYTPLTLAAILVVLTRRMPIWGACLLTAIAGFYAVMSRSTWIAAPAAFAVFLAFLETRDRSRKERWIRAIALGISGFAGSVLYMKRDLFSGLFGSTAQSSAVISDTVETAAAASTAAMEAVPPIFTPAWFQYYFSRQPLIWARLWPNETYTPGIILGLLAAILPVILLIMIWKHQEKWLLDGWQRLLLIAGSAIFLIVGIIISTKIGGGSNLHNLDMYLILLLIIAALAWKAGMGGWLVEKIQAGSWISLIVLASILIPIAPDASRAVPRVYPSEESTQDALNKINEVIHAHPGEEILFMDQRQLLTFGSVPKIPLVADYEKKWMMDEAMANNEAFFQPYIEDMKKQRFAAIISEPLHIKFQGSGKSFSEENDLFVTWVSIPALCYYEPYETFDAQGVQILIPRKTPLVQEGVDCP